MSSKILETCIECAEGVRQVFLRIGALKRWKRMRAKVDNDTVATARAKLERLQKSSKYRSFFNVDAVDAFSKVEGTAFAGTPLKLSLIHI